VVTADVRRVFRGSAKWGPGFVVGAAGTTLGTLAAYAAGPKGALGQEGWKKASALMARHIGGAVNSVAEANALEMTPSTGAAGWAADN
jgi:Predicted integral membrane protein